MISDNELDALQAKAYYDMAAQGDKMSRPERLFNNSAYVLLQDFVPKGVNVVAMMYEWVSLRVPGGRYTPDFFVLFDDGSIAFVEVKQQAVSRSGKKYYAGRSSYRDSRSKLRAAAEINPWFKFYMAVYNSRDGWRIEPIVPARGIDTLIQHKVNGGKRNGK